jgi:hypothetical protein
VGDCRSRSIPNDIVYFPYNNYIYERARRKPAALETKRDGKGKYLRCIKGTESLENTLTRRKESKKKKIYIGLNERNAMTFWPNYI